MYKNEIKKGSFVKVTPVNERALIIQKHNRMMENEKKKRNNEETMKRLTKEYLLKNKPTSFLLDIHVFNLCEPSLFTEPIPTNKLKVK